MEIKFIDPVLLASLRSLRELREYREDGKLATLHNSLLPAMVVGLYYDNHDVRRNIALTCKEIDPSSDLDQWSQ